MRCGKAIFTKLFAPGLCVLGLTLSAGTVAYGEATQRCIEKACFDERTVVGGESLPLLGAALKRYLFFDVYTVALYGPPQATSPEAILADVPKKMIFHYLRTIDTGTMIKAADQVLRQNPAVDLVSLKPRLDQINGVYRDVNADDRYEFTYVPGDGCTLTLNGEFLIKIPGDDFARGYFGIWLSRYPLSDSLRDELLKPPPMS